MAGEDGVKLGDYLLSEIMRRVRRTADLSQRELAAHAGVSKSLVGEIEAGTATPSLTVGAGSPLISTPFSTPSSASGGPTPTGSRRRRRPSGAAARSATG